MDIECFLQKQNTNLFFIKLNSRFMLLNLKKQLQNKK